MRGLVTKSTGSAYNVYLDDGTTIECRIKGNFRIRGIRSTNPVAVGDYVTVVRDTPKKSPLYVEGQGEVFWITDIEERRNYIIRRSTNLSKESHILAANLDQVALIVTINHPVTSTTFIDRFLATAEAYRVPAILIFNKVDLLSEDELALLADLRSLYEGLGYTTYAISAKEMAAVSTNSQTESSLWERGLQGVFSGKVTLLSGNSGVGKSTLLNALFGEERTRTGLISSAHDKGMHTTTFSEMYRLPLQSLPLEEELEGSSKSEGVSWIIDTPGIKGFGSVHMEREEVGHYFREIFRISADCRYGNCLHCGEPGCAVQSAVVDGSIAISRFESYMSLLGDCDEGKYR